MQYDNERWSSRKWKGDLSHKIDRRLFMALVLCHRLDVWNSAKDGHE